MVFFAQKVAHFVFFYYLCARKIGDVHQLAADVDYFADTRMLRTLHSKIRDVRQPCGLTCTIFSCEDASHVAL